jgi:hypothetical protein
MKVSPMATATSRRDMLLYAAVALAGFAGTGIYVAQRDGASLPWQRGTAEEGVVANERSALARATALTGPDGKVDDGQHAEHLAAVSEEEAAQSRMMADAVSEASQLAVTGSSREQRSAGVNRLAAMASGPAAIAEPAFFAALEVAATSDQEWQIRVRAIQALSRAAQQMTDKSRVAAILERAASDPQKSVAMHARRALENLAAAPADASGVPAG